MIPKKEPNEKVIIFALSVLKNQSKVQNNTTFLLIDIKIWINSYARTWQKKLLLKCVSLDKS